MKKMYLLCSLVVILINTPANAQYTTLLNFDGTTNGANPCGSLFSDSTFLYGMTRYGGTNYLGTIFKIMPDGTGYTKLLDFSRTTHGAFPTGTLIYDGTFLYGTTDQGGTNDFGTIFKIMPDGTGYVKLLDFEGSTNGRFPQGSLISDGTFLYGMTYMGGSNDMGTIYKIMLDGTGYTKLLDFADTTNGKYPFSSLISDGTFLYGVTLAGGTNGKGSIFKIMPDGTGYVQLFDFAGSTNGRSPHGSLFYDGTFLYGTTNQGGTNEHGTIFKIMPNGTGYVKLFDFAFTINGRYPLSPLISDGIFLYGRTHRGGTNDAGTIFKIMPNGTGYIKLHDFVGPIDWYNPSVPLFYNGTSLYGMLNQGGTNNLGELFKLGMTTGLDEANVESEFTIYPNPTAGIITLSMPKATGINGEQSISITNILGEVVLSKEINLVASSTFTIDISNQPAGVYFLKMGNSVEKIIRH